MGLIDRILRVIRANINNLLGKAEDPEKILEQTVLEMQNNLVLLRQSVAQAIATQKRTDRQANQAQSNAEEWYRRAQLALQQGNDSLAREALTKRKFYQETATALVTQMEPHKIVVDRLKTDMQTLSNKISEAKTKKDMFIARARSAQASANINEMLGGINPRSSLNAFERMEEKVMEIEAQSAAIAELGTDDLQQKFASLEAGGEIDSELAAMKQQMITGDHPPKQLPKS